MSEVVVFQTDDQFEHWVEDKAVHIETVASNAYAEMGRTLRDVQAAYRYRRNGEGFVTWLATRLPSIPQSSAYQMIDAAAVPLEMFTNFGNISLATQAEIGRSDDDVQAEINTRLAAGEIFTAAQVRDLRAEMQAEAAAEQADRITNADIQIHALETRIRELQASGEDAREEVIELRAEIAEYKERVKDAKSKLPTPKQAEALAKERGGAVLGRDMKYHSGASDEEREATTAFLKLNMTLAAWNENRTPAATIAVGCPAGARRLTREACASAVAYLTEIMEALADDQEG